MPELTDEQKKRLAQMEREAQKPRPPVVISNPRKFLDNVLVPADQYRDWHEIADEGERRAAKQERRGKRKPEPK